MKLEPCLFCCESAETHIDDAHRRHVCCRLCGSYIATEEFGRHYEKLAEDVRDAFVLWLASTKDNSRRYLYASRPPKGNPYSARDGFEMINVRRLPVLQLAAAETQGRERRTSTW